MEPGGGVDPLGHRILALISQRWVVAILLELADGPLRPHELERRLPALSHAGLMRRLRELSQSGAVRHRRSRDIPPRAHYALTRSGEELLTIVDRAARWEDQAGTLASSVPGAKALRLVADQRTLAIVGGLALEPSGPRELGRRILPTGHAALMRRLVALSREGLVVRHQRDGEVIYEPTATARGLAALAILAMGWERARDGDERDPPPSDLLGMIRLIAPLAAPPVELHGACHLSVQGANEREAGLWLLAGGGTLSVIGDAPPMRLALARAPLDTWLRTLLTGPPSAIVTIADPVLTAGVVGALAALLRTRRLDSLFDLLKIA
jgi:DNA-binding HxlR family transcriptional regulator